MTSNFLVLFFVLLGVGCTPQCEKSQFEPGRPIADPLLEFKTENLRSGEGPSLKKGDLLQVHYQAWLYDRSGADNKGKLVGDTYASGKAQTIRYGADELIDGWEEGLEGLKTGAKRRLFVPAPMAYGNEGAGTLIPPGANLVYDIEVVSIKESPAHEAANNEP